MAKRKKKTPKRVYRPHMDRETFVDLWQSCEDADDACNVFPSWPQARARAAFLRSIGVKLKDLGRKSRVASIEKLNKMCGGK
jgi:hypothetical protein